MNKLYKINQTQLQSCVNKINGTSDTGIIFVEDTNRVYIKTHANSYPVLMGNTDKIVTNGMAGGSVTLRTNTQYARISAPADQKIYLPVNDSSDYGFATGDSITIYDMNVSNFSAYFGSTCILSKNSGTSGGVYRFVYTGNSVWTYIPQTIDINALVENIDTNIFSGMLPSATVGGTYGITTIASAVTNATASGQLPAATTAVYKEVNYLSTIMSGIRPLASTSVQPVIYISALPSATTSKYGITQLTGAITKGNDNTRAVTQAAVSAYTSASLTSVTIDGGSGGQGKQILTSSTRAIDAGSGWCQITGTATGYVRRKSDGEYYVTSTTLPLTDLPSATISTSGITKLTNDISGKSNSLAATPSGVYAYTSAIVNNAITGINIGYNGTTNNKLTATNNAVDFGSGWARVTGTSDGLVTRTTGGVYGAAKTDAISAYLPSATTSKYGITKLTHTINATDGVAPTPSGVYKYTSGTLTGLTLLSQYNTTKKTCTNREMDFGSGYCQITGTTSGIVYKEKSGTDVYKTYNADNDKRIPSTYLPTTVAFSAEINGIPSAASSNKINLGTGWVNVESPTTNGVVYYNGSKYATSSLPWTSYASAVTINSKESASNSHIDFGSGWCQIKGSSAGVVRRTAAGVYSASAIGDSDIPTKYLSGIKINNGNEIVGATRVADLGTGWVNVTSPSDGKWVKYTTASGYVTEALPGGSTSQSGILQLTGSIANGNKTDVTKAVTVKAVWDYANTAITNYISGGSINGAAGTVNSRSVNLGSGFLCNNNVSANAGFVWKTANGYSFNLSSTIPMEKLPSANLALSGTINGTTSAVSNGILDFGQSFVKLTKAEGGIAYKTASKNEFGVYNSSTGKQVPANYLPSGKVDGSYGVVTINGNTLAKDISGSANPMAASAVYAYTSAVVNNNSNFALCATINGGTINTDGNILKFENGWARINNSSTGIVYKTGLNAYAVPSKVDDLSSYLPSATTSKYGITKLTNDIAGKSDTLAATPSGVYAVTSGTLTGATINSADVTVNTRSLSFGDGWCQINNTNTGLVKKTGKNDYTTYSLLASDIPTDFLTAVAINGDTPTPSSRKVDLGSGFLKNNVVSADAGFVWKTANGYSFELSSTIPSSKLPTAATNATGIVQLTGSISNGSDNTKAVTQAAVSSFASAAISTYLSAITINGTKKDGATNKAGDFGNGWCQISTSDAGWVKKTGLNTYTVAASISESDLPSGNIIHSNVQTSTVAAGGSINLLWKTAEIHYVNITTTTGTVTLMIPKYATDNTGNTNGLPQGRGITVRVHNPNGVKVVLGSTTVFAAGQTGDKAFGVFNYTGTVELVGNPMKVTSL